MNEDVVIRADGLWKRYGLLLPGFVRRGQQRLRSLRDGQRPHDDGPWALRDISFAVRRGEILGVIGRNGAGKSTLLKVLAGVTPPTLGQLEVRGRVFPMIELNAGLHPYLTGRQNVYLLGAVVGFSRKEMQARMPDIEAFCELGDFFDRQVWTYSTGMLARLGFAVAVNVDADVLLIDEVLAVGDLGFQKKCYDRIDAIRRGGATIVLVSHSLRQIQRLGDHVLWLEKGVIAKGGEPEEVTRSYMEQMTRERYVGAAQGSQQPGICESSGEITLVGVKTFDRRNGPTEEFATFEPLSIQVEYEACAPLDNLILGIDIYTYDMIMVYSFTTEMAIPSLSLPLGRSTLSCTIPKLLLLPGVYFINTRLKNTHSRTLFRGERLAFFQVRPVAQTQMAVGLVHAEVEWTVNSHLAGAKVNPPLHQRG